MAELTIDFFDSDLNYLGVIDNAEDVSFTRSWYEIGEFAIKYNINANAQYASLLVEDNIVMFNKNVYKCGVISKITNQIGEKGKGDQYRVAKGFELKTIFNWRVVGQLNKTMPDGMVTWYKSAPAETCIKSLVSDQCGATATDAYRVFPALQIAADLARGANYVINERYTSLYNVIFTCCSAAQLGWYCYLDLTNKKIIFDCAVGKDRTSSQSTNTWAIFSADRDTLREASIEKSKDGDYSNLIWVGGSTEVNTTYSGATPPSGMLRHEKWIDQTSVTATDTETQASQLATIGAANLVKYSQTYMLDGSPLAFSKLVYMTDYDIGDTVEVNDGTNTYSVQILSAQEEWQNNNYNLTLTWGKPTPTITRQLYETVNRAKGTALNASTAQVVAAQAEIAAQAASVKLSLSSSGVIRDRTGTMTPALVTISTSNPNGTAYAGRFVISASADGVTYYTQYTSASDESSYVYTIPKSINISGTDYYTASFIVKAYMSGGTTTKTAEQYIFVTLDQSTTPLYWGPRTTAPTLGMLPNDYYFDSNIPASGGGVIRYYTGSAWALATTAWPFYQTAWNTAMPDAVKWCTDNGSTITAVTAFISNLVANNAFITSLATSNQYSAALCNDTITPRMEIDWDHAIMYLRNALQSNSARLEDAAFTSYTGYNQYRRAVRQTASSLEFLDSPVSGTDVVKASIYRQPKGTGSVVLHGDIKSEVTLPYTAVEYQVSGTTRNWYDIAWSPELGLFCAVANNSNICATSPDGKAWAEHTISLVTRYWTAIAWSAKLGLFCAVAYNSSICATSPDGIIWSEHTISSVSRGWWAMVWSPEREVFCCVASDSTVCATSTDGLSWTEHTISASNHFWRAIAWSPELGLFCAVAGYFTPSGGSAECATSPDGVTWTEHTTIAAGREWNTIEWSAGLGLFCIVASNSTVCATSPDGVAWTERTISASARYWSMLAWSPELKLFCAIASSTKVCATSANGIDWTEHTISATSRAWQAVVWSPDISAFCIVEQSQYSALITTLELDKVGTGIIERGSNLNGSYIKFGDGTLICWWTDTVLTTTTTGGPPTCYATKDVVFPATFISSPTVAMGTSSNNNLTYLGGTVAPTATGCTIVLMGASTISSALLNYSAIGRWKA